MGHNEVPSRNLCPGFWDSETMLYTNTHSAYVVYPLTAHFSQVILVASVFVGCSSCSCGGLQLQKMGWPKNEGMPWNWSFECILVGKITYRLWHVGVIGGNHNQPCSQTNSNGNFITTKWIGGKKPLGVWIPGFKVFNIFRWGCFHLICGYVATLGMGWNYQGSSFIPLHVTMFMYFCNLLCLLCISTQRMISSLRKALIADSFSRDQTFAEAHQAIG